MRIQHNIMAMNAYRNYNNNNKALSGNLEKLSSGYKINRAGDDAAGLAISEKMRAQITGLEAAQKNVKDGISLVKTAEGAMQEIQDMLNRMDYLATQSANGTYDNEVDRAALQKEVDQLKTEINRIADSANFNGIKLLDGSLDGSAKAATAASTKAVDIPAVGDELGVDTILHNDGIVPDKGTTFSVDMHEVEFTAQKGEKLTISVGEGDNKFDITLETTADETALKGQDILTKIMAGTTGNFKVTIDGEDVASAIGANSTVTINDIDYNITAANGRLTFTQAAGPKTTDEEVDGNLKVSITGSGAAATEPGITGAVTSAAVTETTQGGATATAKYTYDFAGITAVKAGDYEVQIAGKTVNVTLDADGNASDLATKVAAALDAADFEDGITTGANPSTYTIAATGSTVTFTASADGAIAADNAIAGDITVIPKPKDAGANPVSGDYNTQTTNVKNVSAADKQRLASTVVKLDESVVADGNKIMIGYTDYEFTTNEAAKNDPTKGIYIGDMVGKGNKIDMEELARRISVAAKDNDVWTVSAHADRKGLTLVEKTTAAGASSGNTAVVSKAGNTGKLDLTTEEGIKASLGFKIAAKDAVAADDSKALTLQIGDTSESFNQMKVSVGDMHVDAMGTGKYTDENGNEVEVTKTIADIDISNQEGAAEAINVIKNAINYVSSVRGDLGAIQNRLDHTANNLSVMAENIQDAESTIRDTDVAEEMMKYVKNNILVQSAQAMLAQANQVPQGVLQLLG